MPRLARPVFPGVPHHITQRGNRREDVFFNDADRAAYLTWLKDYGAKYHVRILAYCQYGKISTLAAATLRTLGYSRAVALDGGVEAWTKAGYPMETGTPAVAAADASSNR